MTAPGSSEITSPARVILWLLSVYKLIFSQLFTGSCRFVPSCSTYAVEAVARHGALRGSWFAVLRVGRCHPLCRGGLDQVPVSRSSTDGATGS